MVLESITAIKALLTMGTVASEAVNFITEYKIQQTIRGSKIGNDALENFITDFEKFKDEKKIYWCQKLFEIINSRQNTYLPTAGRLIIEYENIIDEKDKYLNLKATKAVLEITEYEYEFLIKIAERHYRFKNYPSNQPWEDQLANIWGNIKESSETSYMRNVLHQKGLVLDSESILSSGFYSGGKISIVSEIILDAHKKVDALY